MATDPPTDDIESWTKRFASQANNRAWALAEQPARTPHEDDEMLHAAHASRHLWASIGTAKNHALGDLLVAQVHALLRLGPSALHYARAAHGLLTGPGTEAWEVAFAHAVLAHAAHAAGDRALHFDAYERAVTAAKDLEGEDRTIFDATFRTVPAPRR